jgi:hypothetical protein
MLWKAILAVGIFALIVSMVYFISRRQQANAPGNIAELVERLDELGFYKYARPEDIARLKTEAVATGYPFGDEALQREYLADAEDLAEGGVKPFLDDLTPQLRVLGVQIDSISQEIGGDTDHIVAINGKPHLIYSVAELSAADLWQRTSTRTFALINAHLERAGSEERVYQLYGGHDCRAILLTRPMYEAIKASKLIADKDMPQPVSPAQL